MNIDREYLFFENHEIFGKVVLHYGDLKVRNFPILPVLKPIELRDYHRYSTEFKIGYLDVQNVFFECPITFHFFQLKYLWLLEDYSSQPYKKSLDIKFLLFDKDFKNYKNFEIDLPTEDLTICGHLINRLNIFVIQNGDINKLNFKDIDYRNFRLKDHRILIEVINNLQIDIFENSESNNKPGGDDYFWDEAEIRNLPNDPYLQFLIEKNLLKQKKGFYKEKVIKAEFGLIFELNHYSAYAPAQRRKHKDTNNDKIINSIKDQLKVDIATDYDSEGHFAYNIVR